MLSHKVERLVRQCYPPGNGSEKRPKGSELSYLMYYLTTHRNKIPRTAEFLEEKAHKYISRNKVGNAMVTLEIVKSMVGDCHEDLNTFAPNVLDIVGLAVVSKDESLVELSAQVFEAFNEYDDGLLFASDQQYVETYVSVIRQYMRLAMSDGPQARRHREVALQALSSLTESPAVATATGLRAVEDCIPSFYQNIPVDNTGIVFSRFTEDFDDYERAQIHTPASAGSAPAGAKAQEPTGPKSLVALRNIFDTSDGTQVARATSGLIKCLDVSRPIKWAQSLLQAAAQWSQIQLRFRVLNTIVERMVRVDVGQLAVLRMYSALVQALLDSSESLVGLSVVDVLRQILKLQHRLVSGNWDSGQQKQVRNLISDLRGLVGALGQHTIYPGQISDMVGEILYKYANVSTDLAPTAGSVAGSTPSDDSDQSRRTPGVIVSDLQDIRSLLDALPPSECLPVSVWTSTQWLLTSDDPQVLTFYARTFLDFLERAQPVAQPYSRLGTSVSRQLVLSLLDRGNQTMNFVACYYCLCGLVEHLRDDAPSALPWLLHVQSIGERAIADHSHRYSPIQAVGHLSVSQALILAVSRVSGHSSAADKALQVINERVSLNQWLPGILYPNQIPIEEAVATAVHQPPQSPASQTEQPIILFGDLELTPSELEWATDPIVPIDDPVVPEDLNIFKTRARSINGSSHSVSDERFLSNRTASTFQSQGPRPAELKKRVTSTFEVPAYVSPPRNPTPKVDMVSLLGKLKVDGSSRGRLVV